MEKSFSKTLNWLLDLEPKIGDFIPEDFQEYNGTEVQRLFVLH